MPSLPSPVPPLNYLQLQSPLIQLPAEIKHIIYGYCFAAQEPITDPPIGDLPTQRKATPNLGVALLQTCRRVYREADRRLLFSQNTFCFTTVDRVRLFFRTLDETFRVFVQDIEIDARKIHSDHPGIAREWLHYLACSDGPWGKLLGSLRMDAPNLKCLRLNFESWPAFPMFRAGLWELLQAMLSKVEGLERIVVIGATKDSEGKNRDPWSPVHFVGGDDVEDSNLVKHMSRTIAASENAKIIQWASDGGRQYLEVVSQTYLVRHVDRYWCGPTIRQNTTDPWPKTGSCTMNEYQSSNLNVAESFPKSFNHSDDV